MIGIPKISIVIACYNDPDVAVAVRSAWNQTYLNKEIIVVDDGSDEETKHIINSVRELIDLLVSQENQGQSIARNNGIQRATGKYVLNLDSDDFFEKTFCEKAVAKFEEDVEIKIVTCRANRFGKEGKIDVFTPKGGVLKDFLFSNSALGSSMFKKVEWEKCAGYEEELPILGFEDWEFYIRLLKSGGYAFVLEEVLFNYQLRPNSTTQRIKYERHQKFKEIILKHKELYQESFEHLIHNLFERIEKEEKEKLKRQQDLEYKLGALILNPLRKIRFQFSKR